jgi:ADP-heptose:LPS heptosyltransferase
MKQSSIKKILIIRLGALGDVVHTTIIPSAIKQSYPECEIHYLTQKEIAPILEGHKHIDKIITWDRVNRKSIKQLLQTGCQLFSERYDVVFNLTFAIRNILLSYLACPKRIQTRKYLNESWVEEFFETAKEVFPDITMPKRLYLSADKDALANVKNYLKDKPRPYIIFVAGGGTNNNRQGRIWNIEKYKELSSKILSKYGGTIILSGSKGERKSHEYLASDNVIVTSGEFDIKNSSALYSISDLMISGDTGPIHIASAHNIKTIALLGSTSPDKIKPYGQNGYYIEPNCECKYCWNKRCKKLKEGERYTPCMDSITPDNVMDFIEKNNLL